MIAVIFEVIPHADRKQDYLDMAAQMRPLVEQIDGFISVERFQSLTNPEKLLSLSFFRDDDALNEWRRLTQHRNAQKAGRTKYFKDYRLRVTSVLRDYGMEERAEAPEDSRALHDDT
ncbi:MAG: antibiotic biosynthesis monooxygenase [Roseibium sp.]